MAGIGVVGPGGSCCHSHLLLPGLLFIQTTQYIFMVFLISNFSLKSSYLLLLSSSHSSISHPFPSIFPLQVYFAERESQISLGDLNARNCTGWVEGLNKQNVVAAFNNQTISMVGPQTTAGGSGERTWTTRAIVGLSSRHSGRLYSNSLNTFLIGQKWILFYWKIISKDFWISIILIKLEFSLSGSI